MVRSTSLLVGIAVAALIGAGAGASGAGAAQWRTVTAPLSLAFPRDHGAHLDHRTEWWYLTGTLAAADGRRVGVQLTFFRRGIDPADTAPPASGLPATQVLAAHHAARKAVAPGVSCGDVDAAARGVIEAAGYGEFFVHRTGHGLGMRVHEEPNIIAASGQRLMPGHCFSIEPGIYLAGRFGVRIENIVTCAEGGHVSFNVEPADSLFEVPV